MARLIRGSSLLLAVLWMAALFYLSSQPSLPTPQWFPHQDKLVHAIAYAILGALLLLSMPMKAGGFMPQQALAATLIASLYGISDEFHQSFVPGRQADVLDWAADTGGALLATLLLAWLTRRLIARQ